MTQHGAALNRWRACRDGLVTWRRCPASGRGACDRRNTRGKEDPTGHTCGCWRDDQPPAASRHPAPWLAVATSFRVRTYAINACGWAPATTRRCANRAANPLPRVVGCAPPRTAARLPGADGHPRRAPAAHKPPLGVCPGRADPIRADPVVNPAWRRLTAYHTQSTKKYVRGLRGTTPPNNAVGGVHVSSSAGCRRASGRGHARVRLAARTWREERQRADVWQATCESPSPPPPPAHSLTVAPAAACCGSCLGLPVGGTPRLRGTLAVGGSPPLFP